MLLPSVHADDNFAGHRSTRRHGTRSEKSAAATADREFLDRLSTGQINATNIHAVARIRRPQNKGARSRRGTNRVVILVVPLTVSSAVLIEKV